MTIPLPSAAVRDAPPTKVLTIRTPMRTRAVAPLAIRTRALIRQPDAIQTEAGIQTHVAVGEEAAGALTARRAEGGREAGLVVGGGVAVDVVAGR